MLPYPDRFYLLSPLHIRLFRLVLVSFIWISRLCCVVWTFLTLIFCYSAFLFYETDHSICYWFHSLRFSFVSIVNGYLIWLRIIIKFYIFIFYYIVCPFAEVKECHYFMFMTMINHLVYIYYLLRVNFLYIYGCNFIILYYYYKI